MSGTYYNYSDINLGILLDLFEYYMTLMILKRSLSDYRCGLTNLSVIPEPCSTDPILYVIKPFLIP